MAENGKRRYQLRRESIVFEGGKRVTWCRYYGGFSCLATTARCAHPRRQVSNSKQYLRHYEIILFSNFLKLTLDDRIIKLVNSVNIQKQQQDIILEHFAYHVKTKITGLLFLRA